MTLLSREAKVAECHDRALEASAQAETTLLGGVREKHQVAAARWRALAELYERGGRDPVTGLATSSATGSKAHA
jgi:hypothetical protein